MKRGIFSILLLAAAITACSAGNSNLESAGQAPFPGVGIVAHRGFWDSPTGGGARNSIAALRAAQEAGFWGSEFDVNMTSDSVLLVFHNSSIDGKKIEKNPHSTFADFRLENGEPIPTLDAFLTQAEKSRKTKLVFELKQHSTPEVEDLAISLSLQMLADHGLLHPDRVIFISFSLHACREFARRCPGFSVQYLGANLWPCEVLTNGINGIDMNFFYYLLMPRMHDEARALGMTVNVWTVNSEADIRKVIATGIDLITTDNPLLAREILGEKEVTIDPENAPTAAP